MSATTWWCPRCPYKHDPAITACPPGWHDVTAAGGDRPASRRLGPLDALAASRGRRKWTGIDVAALAVLLLVVVMCLAAAVPR